MPVMTPRPLLVARSLVVLILASLTSLAAADDPRDEISLKNGSVILGTVKSVRDGVVTVDTDFAGTLSVQLDQVVSIDTREPVVIQLEDETVVRDQPLVIDQRQLVLTRGAAEVQHYPLEALQVVNPEDWELGIGYQWTGLASFALKLERGNSNTDELDYRLDSVWRKEKNRYTVNLRGEIDEANNQEIADNWEVHGKYDHFVSDHTYWGVNAFVESDDFADLDLRYYLGPFVGRDFYTDPVFTLSAGGGIAYVKEEFIVAPNQDYTAANWQFNMSSNYLGGDSRLFFDQRGIWNLDQTSDVIVNTSFGLSFPLIWRLEAAAEVLLEYDSGAVEGIEELDETYNFRIGYRW